MRVCVDPFDVASFFAMRELLSDLDPSGEPRLATLSPMSQVRSVALLPGSFNPPTAAHSVLADRALSEGYDAVVLLLARATVGKEHTGLLAEDRLLAMRAACGTKVYAAACSHGLYADQAEAAMRAFPGADISFLVGSDKVAQIFDDRWYPDRDEALHRLFSCARVIAAPRGSHGEQVRDVLADPANRTWAARVEILRLHPAVADLSSTRVRGLLRAGADPAGLVPAAVGEVLAQMRAFAPPLVHGVEEVDAYTLRVRLLDSLWSARAQLGDRADLRQLMRIAVSHTEAGRRFRTQLETGDADAADLERAQSLAAG